MTGRWRGRATRALMGLAVLLLVYLLCAWLLLPSIVQRELPRLLVRDSGASLSMAQPRFNPFTLTLRLPQLLLRGADGQPLAQIREFDVELSLRSLVQRALVFDAIRIEQPRLALTIDRRGRLNWAAFLARLQPSPPSAPPTPLPRIAIRDLRIDAGAVDLHDAHAGAVDRVDSLTLHLRDVASYGDSSGWSQLDATFGAGGRLHWQGQAALQALRLDGQLQLTGLDLASLQPYLTSLLPLQKLAGSADLGAHLTVSEVDGHRQLRLAQASLAIRQLLLRDRAGASLRADTVAVNGIDADWRQRRVSLAGIGIGGLHLQQHTRSGATTELLQLAALQLDGMRVDLARHRIDADSLRLHRGQLHLTRLADGRFDLVQGLQQVLDGWRPRTPAASTTASPRWRLALAKLAVEDWSASLRDAGMRPAARLALDHLQLSSGAISDDLSRPLAVELQAQLRSGGQVSASGRVVPASAGADLQLRLSALQLRPLQPYLARLARLQLRQGRLSLSGRVRVQHRQPHFQGQFALQGLRLDSDATQARFLSWRSLSGQRVTVDRRRLRIGDLRLDGLDTRLAIAADRSLNLSQVLIPQPPTPPAPAATPFAVDISRVRISRSDLDYADASLVLPFATHIHDLHGAVTAVSSRPGHPSLLQLDGQVDNDGLAHADGRIDLFQPADATDIHVVFRNVEMTRLTPYTATFAGRRIDSGKLSLDLRYRFDHRLLHGDNQIVMDSLRLGDRVDSPQARNLPLDLAIAMLRDSDGRIDLGLPVSGSLDDPHFSYGAIIWKAIVNVLVKIATAPLRALGALFGDGPPLDQLVFAPASPRLSPPELGKVQHLAAALAHRPGLQLTVHGVWSDADRVALQDRQLRRAILQQQGIQIPADQDPGPVATDDSHVLQALRTLYSRQFGRGELAALEQGYRAANPGQLRESTAEQLMSRLNGLLFSHHRLDAGQIAALHGRRFGDVLYQRLRDQQTIAAATLQQLADARARQLLLQLGRAGAPVDRVSLGPSQQVQAGTDGVAVVIDVGAVAPAAPASRPVGDLR